MKPKAKRKTDTDLEGKSEWIGGDPEPKNEEGNPAAVAASGKDTEKGKGKEKKTATAEGKEKAGAGGVITEDFGAQGSSDAHVPLQVVPSVSEDDEPDEERRDIERIWLSSDEDEAADQGDEDDLEDEDIIDRKAKRRASTQRPRPPGGGGLRPVRAPRTILPVEEEVDLSAQARKHTKTSAPRSKVSASASAPDFIDVDEMDIDNEVEFIKEVPSSPDLKKKHAKKAAGKGKDVKFSTETVEERAERLRGLEDVSKLRQIFTLMRERDVEGRTAKGKGKGREGEEEQKRLFLMQFPPLMPFLIDPNAPQPVDGDNDVQEVEAEGPSSTQPASSTAKIPAPPTTNSAAGTATAIKKDPDAPPPPFHPKSSAHTTSPEGILTASSPHRLPAGYVGKLNVHASGKITLDWGGCDMEVRLGTDVGFLQDAIVVDDRPLESQGGREENEERGGMGRHKRKRK